MKIDETEISGFKTKLFYLNDVIIGASTEIGPRILTLAHGKKPEFNLFGVVPDLGVQTSDGFWRIFGGHRLWCAPEAKPRSYSLDNKSVKLTVNARSVTIHGNPEPENATQKEITVKPLSRNSVQVTHTVRNIGRWPIKLACWALSVMRPRGFAVTPIEASKADGDGLLPDRHLTLWPYTHLTDKRLKLSDEYLFLKQDTEAVNPIKIGTMANPPWTVYWVDGYAFVKEFQLEAGEYPDYGCNVEMYTNPAILELETLGPLRTVAPSETIMHTETWRILEVEDLAPEPEAVNSKLKPLIEKGT